VQFAPSFGSTVTGSDTETNADGIARVGTWIIGPVARETYYLTAIVGSAGEAKLDFVVTTLPGPPMKLEWVNKPNALLVPSSMVSAAVRVYDAYNNGVPGVPVHFDVVEGGGSIASEVAVTENAGLATLTEWALGKEPGPNTVVARVSNAIEQRLTVYTDISEVTYRLTAITGGWASASLPLSKLTLDGKTRFVMSIAGNVVGGTYRIQKNMLLLRYDANGNVFQGTIWSPYPYIGNQPVDADEYGIISADQREIVFTRCATEDCYEGTWIYRLLP
jgi:hypothetical protein